MSRDITNMSKKVIFLLHRIALEDDDTSYTRAATRGLSKLREVQDIYASLTHELAGDCFWRYQHQVSPGLQEYIEALSFAYYLQHGTLIPFRAVQHSLSSPEGVPVCDLLSTSKRTFDISSSISPCPCQITCLASQI